MGFTAKGLLCDAPGCGATIGYEASPFARVVFPPKGDAPAPALFACSGACEIALLTGSGEGAQATDLDAWWETMEIILGFAAEAEDDAIGVAALLDALDALEAILERPGVPSGLSVREAIAHGYITRQHLAAVLRTE
jgi:hypothetical protein